MANNNDWRKIMSTALIIKIIGVLAPVIITLWWSWRNYFSPKAVQNRKIKELEDELRRKRDEQQIIRNTSPFASDRYYQLDDDCNGLLRELRHLRQNKNY